MVQWLAKVAAAAQLILKPSVLDGRSVGGDHTNLGPAFQMSKTSGLVSIIYYQLKWEQVFFTQHRL